MIHTAAIADRLEAFPYALSGLVSRLSEADARWRPPAPPGADQPWSIAQIVCHLADEEVHDFRPRLERTLRDTAEPWPPIDPEGWARERDYQRQPLAPALDRFTREREASVRWLRSLDLPRVDWSATHRHPKIGPMRAADLLASWAAHDALHLRQIAKRLFELASRDAEGASTAYAGEWKA